MKQTAIMKAIANLEEGARIIKNLNVSLTAKEVAESLTGFKEYLQSLLPEEKEQMCEAWKNGIETWIKEYKGPDGYTVVGSTDWETYYNNTYKKE